jgi:hypothetical protein
VPIRALIGVQHGPAVHDTEGPSAATIDATLADAGWALAREPWLERWPGIVLAAPARAPSASGAARGRTSATDAGWVLVDDTGALPLVPTMVLPTLLAVSGGRPVIVAGEHRAHGFAPLAVRVHDRAAVLV